jgi:hypothetical protein
LKEDGGTETGSPYHDGPKAVATFSLTIGKCWNPSIGLSYPVAVNAMG